MLHSLLQRRAGDDDGLVAVKAWKIGPNELAPLVVNGKDAGR